jgi:hypothetical protein
MIANGPSMALKLIAFGAALLYLTNAAFADDDMIYHGLHCNSFCQVWMGISPARPARQKRGCLHMVSHPTQYDADLVQLCRFVLGKRGR